MAKVKKRSWKGRLCLGASGLPNLVGNRIIRKRIHVRIEHVQPSRCTEDFKLTKKKNDKLKAKAKVMGEVISTKRQLEGPKPGFMVEGVTLETVTPIPYDVVNDLKGGY
ncbi:60S ribosomal protein L21-1 [Camellia lanceoleosa]|uniref:60S ribosomal protein L21-1 n=1 Tax=Camellia lanceoleosa TaxID=1840588 RepID=A0ACC0IND3_9ERIC|nr:60S ribosomal protein L21-1 [Camellia lanceoleosa]